MSVASLFCSLGPHPCHTIPLHEQQPPWHFLNAPVPSYSQVSLGLLNSGVFTIRAPCLFMSTHCSCLDGTRHRIRMCPKLFPQVGLGLHSDFDALEATASEQTWHFSAIFVPEKAVFLNKSFWFTSSQAECVMMRSSCE